MSDPAPFTYEQYRYILRSAQENGYRFISFPQLEAVRTTDERVCLLRHDCDNDLVAALTVAHIEHELGICSTYFLMLRSAMYNLLSPGNRNLVREIIGLGHWIGLHFDEVPFKNANPQTVAAQVDRERAWVVDEFGIAVEVVSFHQPGERVLNNVIKLNCLNTYDRYDMRDTYYLSDSNTVWKEGPPSNFFMARKHPRLQLLLHPEWWTETEEVILHKWNRMLAHNFELMQDNLIIRERAYTWKQRIEFNEDRN